MNVERINNVVTVNGKKVRDRAEFDALNQDEKEAVIKYRKSLFYVVNRNQKRY